MYKISVCLFLFISSTVYSADCGEIGVFNSFEEIQKRIESASSLIVGNFPSSYVKVADCSLICYKDEPCFLPRGRVITVNLVQAIAQEMSGGRWRNIKIQFDALGVVYFKEKATLILNIYAPYRRIAEYPQFYESREAAVRAYKKSIRN